MLSRANGGQTVVFVGGVLEFSAGGFTVHYGRVLYAVLVYVVSVFFPVNHLF